MLKMGVINACSFVNSFVFWLMLFFDGIAGVLMLDDW